MGNDERRRTLERDAAKGDPSAASRLAADNASTDIRPGQPHWAEEIGALGNIGRLYIDASGQYAPEVEIDETDEDSGRTMVYRFEMPRMARLPKRIDKERRIVPRFAIGRESKSLPHAPAAYIEWFDRKSGDLDSVARSAGRESSNEIRDALCDEDVVVRFHAYMDIAGHYGLDNFDSYPRVIEPDTCEDSPDED